MSGSLVYNNRTMATLRKNTLLISAGSVKAGIRKRPVAVAELTAAAGHPFPNTGNLPAPYSYYGESATDD